MDFAKTTTFVFSASLLGGMALTLWFYQPFVPITNTDIFVPTGAEIDANSYPAEEIDAGNEVDLIDHGYKSVSH